MNINLRKRTYENKREKKTDHQATSKEVIKQIKTDRRKGH